MGLSLLIMLWFRLHIVKETVIWPADYFDNVMTKFIVNNRRDACKIDINLLIDVVVYNKLMHKL